MRSPTFALFRREFASSRVRTISFAYIFGVYAWLQADGYRNVYPTLADRVAFARSFAGNDAIRLFYGYPYNVLTVGGYSAWRVGGTLSILAAVFGILAAIRATRTEEDAGRAEMVLAGPVGRRTVFGSSLGAIALGTGLLWATEFLGFVFGHLAVGGSAYLALATVIVVPVFVGIGAVASQLASDRRMALALAGGTVVTFWLLRVVADTWAAGAWLRWLSPLGWAEELRPFSGARPVVLVFPVVFALSLLVVAARLADGRDIGVGVLRTRDERSARLRLLSSSMAQALRSQGAMLMVWFGGVAAFAVVLGMIATSVSTAGIPKSLQKELGKFGTGSISSPSGYLSFVFIVFILSVSLFACAQVGAAREEEHQNRLEGLFSLPVNRYGWLGGRLAITALACLGLSLAAGVLSWAGATSQGIHISLTQMLEAGANCVPSAMLFLGTAALFYAVAPKASAGLSYGIVGAAFLWYIVGALTKAPTWLVELTPFQHIGLVPAQAFQTEAALVIIAIGAVNSVAALLIFRHRDLSTA